MNEPATDLGAKVAYLSRPESFPDRPPAVEPIETHFAWVFLAGRYAYKLKKPMRFHDFDFTSLATRRVNCELEVSLNRRLAPTVYLGTVPLCIDGGRLGIGGDGTPVEWLVKMHRLPQERSLERLAGTGQLRDAHLAALTRTLARFYGSAPRAHWDGLAYRSALATDMERTAAELAVETRGLDAERIYEVAASLQDGLALHRNALHARIADGRVVDAHGDLRPEHIFLLAEPQIIDCLEISAELRLLDTAAEIAFLALECERLGYAEVAPRIIAHYRQSSGDEISEELLGFYRAMRAFARAKIAAWRLDEELTPHGAALWRSRAEWYIDAAAAITGTHTHESLQRTVDRRRARETRS